MAASPSKAAIRSKVRRLAKKYPEKAIRVLRASNGEKAILVWLPEVQSAGVVVSSSGGVEMTNIERFKSELTSQYRDLFLTDPEYKFAAANTTPEALAEKMTEGLKTGRANKDGKGIKRTCKMLGIPYTYKGIRAYLETLG